MRKSFVVAAFVILATGLTISAEVVSQYHTVKKGETLSAISRKYDIGQNTLRKINKLASSKISPGQQILIRTSAAKSQNSGTSVVSSGNRSSSRKNLLAKKTSRRYASGSRLVTTYYTVRKGDSLSAISRRTGTSVAMLKKLNRLKGTSLKAGRRLKVRRAIPEQLLPPPDINPNCILQGTEKVYYKVQEGDTLESIAEKFNVAEEELKTANLLSLPVLKLGQILVIPTVGSEQGNAGRSVNTSAG